MRVFAFATTLAVAYGAFDASFIPGYPWWSELLLWSIPLALGDMVFMSARFRNYIAEIPRGLSTGEQYWNLLSYFVLNAFLLSCFTVGGAGLIKVIRWVLR